MEKCNQKRGGREKGKQRDAKEAESSYLIPRHAQEQNSQSIESGWWWWWWWRGGERRNESQLAVTFWHRMRHAHIFYMENFANRIEGLSRGTVLDDVVLGIFHTLRKKLERKKKA